MEQVTQKAGVIPCGNAALAKAKVTRTQALECRAIRSDNVGVEQICSRHEPCIILAHPACGATLQE